MMYLGSTTASTINQQIAYVYLTDNDVTRNSGTYNMNSEINELFEEGVPGTKRTTIWKNDDSDRLDLQYDNASGGSIDGTLGTGSFSNYSFQSGKNSYGVVFIKNTITSRVAIDTALKANSNNKPYDVLLLRLLMTMMILSNVTGKKIAITDTQIRNQRPMNAATQGSLEQAQIQAKAVLVSKGVVA